MVLWLTVRRFFCDRVDCGTVTFVEQVVRGYQFLATGGHETRRITITAEDRFHASLDELGTSVQNSGYPSHPLDIGTLHDCSRQDLQTAMTTKVNQVGRRLFLRGTAAAALGALAACTSDNGSRPVSSSASTSLPSGPVTLEILDWSNPQASAVYKSVDLAFMKLNPNVTIKRTPVPYDNTPERLRALIAAKSGPDILPGFPGAYGASFKHGLTPLNDYIGKQEQATWRLLKGTSPDGNTYLIPDTGYAYVMSYNKDLFTRVGLSNAPTNWSSFLAACNAFVKAGITPIAAGWKDGYYAEGWLYEFMGYFMTDLQKQQFARFELPYTDPLVTKSLDLLRGLSTAGYFGPGAAGQSYSDAVNQFASGKAGMVLGGNFDNVTYAKLLGNKLDVFPLPPPPGAVRQQFLDYGPTGGWGIAEWSKNKPVAWSYIQHLMSPNVQQSNWDAYRALPAVSDVKIQTTDEPSRKLLEWIKWPANSTVYTAFPQSVSAVFEKQAAPMIGGALSSSAVASQMQSALDSVKPGILR